MSGANSWYYSAGIQVRLWHFSDLPVRAGNVRFRLWHSDSKYLQHLSLSLTR